MNKRLLDKKVVKISFNKSSNDQQQYFNYGFDVNFSSDEENYFNGKSEILWSRAGDYFEYSDSPQSFSDAKSLSSCSWHNDEFDMQSTSKVNASLEAIEDALYEKIRSPFMSEMVFQECCDWAEKFPYLRIKGEQIAKPIEDNYILHSTRSVASKEYNSLNFNAGLHLEGTKLPLHASRGVCCIDCSGDNKVPDCFGEEIDADEEEEYLALHKSDIELDTCLKVAENAKSVFPEKQLQEKVLERLVSEMWPSVLAFLGKLDDRNSVEDLQLPPIVFVAEQKRSLNLPRPRTEGSSFMSTEFPKLNNVLTVSPKILQKREFRNGQAIRPSSEMSVGLRVSSTSLKSISNHSNQNSSSNLHTKGENTFIKGSRRERDTENTCLVLPALEEDFQDTSSVLRGFHIEPSKKESTHKSDLSDRNECETISTSQVHNYFLPPIEDKSYIPSNLKLTQNLFTFYGSSLTSDKSKQFGSVTYKKTISRPSTSISKKLIRNHENPLRSGLFISSRKISKTPGSFTERNSEASHHEKQAAEINQEKSVTLFPIVTPLTPHGDRHQSNRKGILHSFLGVKKR